ncbi:MAG: T9SS type A sorting domain-containing protein [Salinivirgaceae bacterium]
MASGQNTYTYLYDDFGNRTSRTIGMNKSAAITPDSTETISGNYNLEGTKIDGFEKEYHDNVGDVALSIFPNPTAGLIKIEITNGDVTSGEFILTDSKGAILQNSRSVQTSQEIDLSNYADGVYLMKIQINGKTTEWRIVKQ